MSMETNPPTSELMSPVHSFPNRFIDNDEERSEERKSDRSIPDEERGFVMKMLIYEVRSTWKPLPDLVPFLLDLLCPHVS